MSTQIWENDQTSNQQKIQVAMFVEKIASLNEEFFHRYSWLSLPKGTPKLFFLIMTECSNPQHSPNEKTCWEDPIPDVRKCLEI